MKPTPPGILGLHIYATLRGGSRNRPIALATVGLPVLRAGRKVVVRGTGERFDGRYIVTSTRHVIGDQGYRTDLEARPIALKRKPGAKIAKASRLWRLLASAALRRKGAITFFDGRYIEAWELDAQQAYLRRRRLRGRDLLALNALGRAGVELGENGSVSPRPKGKAR